MIVENYLSGVSCNKTYDELFVVQKPPRVTIIFLASVTFVTLRKKNSVILCECDIMCVKIREGSIEMNKVV